MRVVLHLLESEFASDGFEVGVVRMRQCRGEIHAAAAPERDFRFLVDHTFAQRRQSHGKFDGRAGLRTARKRELLVDHGEDASAGRLDGDHSAVHVAQGIDCRLTNDGVFPGSHVTFGDIGCERTDVEALVIIMMAATGGRRSRGNEL